MWNPSGPGDWTHVPCIDRQTLNHWTTRDIPWITPLISFLNCPLILCRGITHSYISSLYPETLLNLFISSNRFWGLCFFPPAFSVYKIMLSANRNSFTFFYFFFLNLTVPGLSCGMWDLVPLPETEPGPAALELGCPWATRDVLLSNFGSLLISFSCLIALARTSRKCWIEATKVGTLGLFLSSRESF